MLPGDAPASAAVSAQRPGRRSARRWGAGFACPPRSAGADGTLWTATSAGRGFLAPRASAGWHSARRAMSVGTSPQAARRPLCSGASRSSKGTPTPSILVVSVLSEDASSPNAARNVVMGKLNVPVPALTTLARCCDFSTKVRSGRWTLRQVLWVLLTAAEPFAWLRVTVSTDRVSAGWAEPPDCAVAFQTLTAAFEARGCVVPVVSRACGWPGAERGPRRLQALCALSPVGRCDPEPWAPQSRRQRRGRCWSAVRRRSFRPVPAQVTAVGRANPGVSLEGGAWDPEPQTVVTLGVLPVRSLLATGDALWAASGGQVFVLGGETLGVQVSVGHPARAGPVLPGPGAGTLAPPSGQRLSMQAGGLGSVAVGSRPLAPPVA